MGAGALSGQVVAITGAARGIGARIAADLVAAGAKVAISDVDAEALAATAANLGAFAMPLDVRDPDAVDAFLDAVESELGPLDALVNNAGIMPSGPLLDEADATTRNVFEINVLGMMWGSKKALARMVPRGRGHVVNLASTMGLAAVPGLATYCSSKAAMAMYGEVLAAEFAKTGVRVSTVLPGPVNTELTSGMDTTARLPLPLTKRSIPMASVIEPSDVSQAVLTVLTDGVSQPRVVVPRSLGRVLRMQDAWPLAWKRKMAQLMGINDQVLAGTDAEARRAYLERVTD